MRLVRWIEERIHKFAIFQISQLVQLAVLQSRAEDVQGADEVHSVADHQAPVTPCRSAVVVQVNVVLVEILEMKFLILVLVI